MELDFEPVGIALPKPSRHRSRRIRKKMFLDEFQQLGFHVSAALDPGLSRSKLDDLYDRFVEHAIEGNNLSCGGGGSLTQMNFYVMGSANRRHVSATPSQRQAVLDWLESQRDNGVVDYAASPLQDANYDPAPTA